MVRNTVETPPLSLKSNNPLWEVVMGATGIANSWKTEQCKGWKEELNVGINCADIQREHVVAESPETGALKITACFWKLLYVRVTCSSTL